MRQCRKCGSFLAPGESFCALCRMLQDNNVTSLATSAVSSCINCGAILTNSIDIFCFNCEPGLTGLQDLPSNLVSNVNLSQSNNLPFSTIGLCAATNPTLESTPMPDSANLAYLATSSLAAANSYGMPEITYTPVAQQQCSVCGEVVLNHHYAHHLETHLLFSLMAGAQPPTVPPLSHSTLGSPVTSMSSPSLSEPPLVPNSAAFAAADAVTLPPAKRANRGTMPASSSSFFSGSGSAFHETLNSPTSSTPLVLPPLAFGAPPRVAAANIASCYSPSGARFPAPVAAPLSSRESESSGGSARRSRPLQAVKAHGDSKTCYYCGQMFTESEQRQRHEELHLEAITSQRFQCLKCQKKFDTNDEIIQHYQTSGHQTFNRKSKHPPYYCSRCGKYFDFPRQACKHFFHKYTQRFHIPPLPSMLSVIQQIPDGRFRCCLDGCSFIGCSQEVFSHMHEMHPGRTIESCYATKI